MVVVLQLYHLILLVVTGADIWGPNGMPDWSNLGGPGDVNIGPPGSTTGQFNMSDAIARYIGLYGPPPGPLDGGTDYFPSPGDDGVESEPGPDNFDYTAFDPSGGAGSIIDDTGIFRDPLNNMILGNTGANALLGQHYIDAIDSGNPYAAQYDVDPVTGARTAKPGSVLGELEGMLQRSNDKAMEDVVNRYSATNKLGAGSFRSAMSDQMNDGYLDQLARARINFGIKEADFVEPARRNRLSDLAGFNQSMINNLSSGLDQAQSIKQSDIGAQQSVWAGNNQNFYDFLNAQQGAAGWTQEMMDQGLKMYLQGQTGGGGAQNAMLAGATQGMGNVINQPQSNPWGDLSSAIASYQYSRPNEDDD